MVSTNISTFRNQNNFTSGCSGCSIVSWSVAVINGSSSCSDGDSGKASIRGRIEGGRGLLCGFLYRFAVENLS